MEINDVLTAALTRSMNKASPNVIMTATLISAQHGTMLSIEKLAELLDVKKETITQQISREVFPVPITKVGKLWFATAYDLAEYLERQKQTFVA